MTSKNGLKMTSFDIFKFNHPYFTASCFFKGYANYFNFCFVKEVIVIFSHDPRVSVLDHWTLQFPASVSSMRAFLTFVCNISFRKQSAAAFDFQGFQRERMMLVKRSRTFLLGEKAWPSAHSKAQGYPTRWASFKLLKIKVLTFKSLNAKFKSDLQSPMELCMVAIGWN